MSIWSAAMRRPKLESLVVPVLSSDKLPAQSLVILAQPVPQRLADLAAERSIAA
jgi:hypothetical protein